MGSLYDEMWPQIEAEWEAKMNTKRLETETALRLFYQSFIRYGQHDGSCQAQPGPYRIGVCDCGYNNTLDAVLKLRPNND